MKLVKKEVYGYEGIEFDVEYTVDNQSRKWETTTLKLTPINDPSMLRVKLKVNGKEHQLNSVDFIELEIYGNNENADVQYALNSIFKKEEFEHVRNWGEE